MELKDIIGTEPEDFFDAITGDVTELVKYAALFNTESSKEYYLGILNELYSLLIKQCKVALIKHYQKEINNIFSEKIPPLPEIREITKTITKEDTLILEEEQEEEHEEVEKPWKLKRCPRYLETRG